MQEFCEHCVLSKKIKVKFGTAVHHNKGILHYVHTNMWGPSKNASLGEKYYFISFVDDYSRRNYVMTHKSKVLGIFLEWRKKWSCR